MCIYTDKDAHTETSVDCGKMRLYMWYIVFLPASVLVYLGKSHGDEAQNLSWRRHKPFICIVEIRGSHFIRRAVSPTCSRVMCPRERLQKHVPLMTRPMLAKRTPSLFWALTWLLCQLHQAAMLTNTPGELPQLIGSCVPKSPAVTSSVI